MSSEPTLVIVGASARAAAFSALRAGLRPWCVDLFADEDLRAVAPVTAVPAAAYPERVGRFLKKAPPGPWMYVGGLENHPRLVDAWAHERPLWGNDGETLRTVRDPVRLSEILRAAGRRGPRVRLTPPEPGDGCWLVKPLAGAGGRGIRVWAPSDPPPPGGHYFQEFGAGEPRSAVFHGLGDESFRVGVTWQLVGEPWLHAPPFAYCGSIGPVPTSAAGLAAWSFVGDLLVKRFGLLGLFGVDAVWHDGFPFVVEVNPRYVASVEVLEYATGHSAMDWQRGVFASQVPTPPPMRPATGVVGKAVLFAPRPFRFPADGPWMATLRQPFDPHALPAFADIPAAGSEIKEGQPVLSFFARADTPEQCQARLRATAAELDVLCERGQSCRR
jgi:predicted ATP-grasp superfamily ATP-dependent carboligase